ncbi:hypothetical protein ENBRE01_0049 [Enteropsectra breve]|nr:hypothetical protein ENBRE01_0049 [Enteropsectra breve]
MAWNIPKFLEEEQKMLGLSAKDAVVHFTKKHPSMMVRYYCETGQKDSALRILTTMRKSDSSVRVIEEVISTYILFGDTCGAKEYLKYYEFANKNVMHLSSLLGLHDLLSSESVEIDSALEIAYSGLKHKYCEGILRCLSDLVMLKMKCTISEIHSNNMEKIEALFDKAYVSKIGTAQLRYLHSLFTKNMFILARIVKTDKTLEKEVYLEYVKSFGLLREDIMDILYRQKSEWALSIAVENGWVDAPLLHELRKRYADAAPFINLSGEWGMKDDRNRILFYNGHEKTEDK